MPVEPLTLDQDIERAIELLNVLQKNPQLPTEKLDALKRILTSDFFQSVREVYERVYDAAQMEGVSTEVAASATAKATVAAFAAAQGHAHPRVVELPKAAPTEGLGFNVMGGREQNSPIFISRIIPGGVAERVGELRRGDQIMSISGVSVEGESHEKAVELLKASDRVTLVVRYTPHVLEQMERRFEQMRASASRSNRNEGQ